MKQKLWLLELEPQQDQLRAQVPVFTRTASTECAFSFLAQETEEDLQGPEPVRLAIAITPQLEAEPDYLEFEGRVFKVEKVEKQTGFGFAHWELWLREFKGEFQIKG